MLIITDITGNTEALTGYKGLKRFRSVSGEKTLAFLILPTEQNVHSFDMVQEESIIDFKGDSYRIKQVSEKPRGKTYFKEVVAIHTLFDQIDEYIYERFTGSKTFQAFLEFVFSGTSYTWDIVDSFYAQDWENLGDDNRLALFQNGLKRYDAEFTLIDNHFTFKQQIGTDTDFQFRYSYNIKTITRNVNTNNLSTYIKGYGKKNEDGSYLIQSEYTSPNANIFGIRHAKPVSDERYTTVEGLNERLKAEIKDTPDVSITLDFVDLRRAGFPYDVPNEGDDVFLFYEPMKLDLETRIMDITEEFTENSDYPIKTEVTLANFRNNMADQFVELSRTQKNVEGLFNGNKQLPYNALDDAVKRATAALQRAETELEFENGIIARDKNNPNFLVLFNSNGIGISRDGGQTFKEAITSEGFVLSAGAIGQLAANNIQIGPDTTFEDGYDPRSVESNAKEYADTIKEALSADIADVNSSVSDLNTYVDGAFKDGIITKAEALSIEQRLNDLNAEKADLESRYSQVYNNTDLVDVATKSDLSNKMTAYRTAHTNHVNAINNAISDSSITEEEKTAVTTTGEAYVTALSNLSSTFEAAVNAIGAKKAENAQSAAQLYADGLKTAIDSDIEDIVGDLANLNTYVDGAFKDGVITEAELIGIKQRMLILNAEKSDLDSRYTQIYGNADLNGTPKTELNTKKTAFDTAHTNLISSINAAILDGSITETEKADVNTKESAYSPALSNLSTAFEDAINAIVTKKATNAQSAAQTYADDLKSAVDSDISDVAGDLSALSTYVDGSFEDGVISKAEAKAIEKYLNQINSEKADIDSRYTAIYAMIELNNSTQKTALATAKTNYNSAHTNLITSINSAIADSSTNETEKADVDSKFVTYRTRLGELSTAFENAINKIAQVKADAAEQGIKDDLRMTAPLPTSLTMNQDGITASTGTNDKYARLDYRGLFINKGAVQIQREDGYNLIMDGMANFDFSVDSADPPFMDFGVTTEGYWFRTSSTTPVAGNYYTFKHTGRYLKIQVAFYKTGSGNTAGIRIAQNGGALLVAKSFITDSAHQNAIVGEVFTVDLGVPTGNMISVYLQGYQDIANGNVYFRKIRAWLER